MKHTWRPLLLAIALSTGALACDSPKAEEASPERALPDDERRRRAEAIVASAKARESAETFDEVELSDDEEKKIREAAASSLDESNLAAEINALETILETEVNGAPPAPEKAPPTKKKKKR